MQISGVLFDLDGVLIDSSRAWHRVINLGRERWGYPLVDYSVFAMTFGQGVEADRAAFFGRQTLADVGTLYDEAFVGQLGAVELIPGAIELLSELGQRGFARAVVTNTPIALARQVLSAKGIARHIETLAASGEAAEKPAPDLVHLALKRLGLNRDQVIYVGDSDSDRQATRAAGVTLAGLGTEGDITLRSLLQLLDHLSR